MDQARVVPGARRGFQAVTNTLVNKGDSVVVSALAHYTEFLAVENAGGVVKEVPLNDRHIVTADATAQKIEDVKVETGKLPVLVMIDHFDYQFANEHEIAGIGKVAHQYGIPFLYNGAYTVGVQPVDGKKIGADFVVGSGHKSMASVAPSGVLAINEEFAPKALRTTGMVGDLTKRKFGIKEVEMLGCTLMGGTLLSMMASFPTVKERVLHWDEELKKSNYFIDTLLRINGSKVLSEYPRKHSLSKDRHDGKLRHGCTDPQTPRLLFLRRADLTGHRRGVCRCNPDLETQHLRSHLGPDPLPCGCVYGDRGKIPDTRGKECEKHLKIPTSKLAQTTRKTSGNYHD